MEIKKKVFGITYIAQTIDPSDPSCKGCVGFSDTTHSPDKLCEALADDPCYRKYIWVEDEDIPVAANEKLVNGVIYAQVKTYDNCNGCSGEDMCLDLATSACYTHYIWVPKNLVDKLPVADVTLESEWADLMSAFLGAFDTPIHRRKHADDVSVDFRDRMHAFNKKHFAKNR